MGCHLKDFQGTTNPNHVSANFPADLRAVPHHDGLVPATLRSLDGELPSDRRAHVPPRQCADCHVNNNYNLTNTACVSCHLKDFQARPIPTTCAADSRRPARLATTPRPGSRRRSITRKSGFPLRAHTCHRGSARDCHVNNNYNITNTACVSCHQTDYNSATNPDHAQAGFPTTCEQCHDTVHGRTATSITPPPGSRSPAAYRAATASAPIATSTTTTTSPARPASAAT